MKLTAKASGAGKPSARDTSALKENAAKILFIVCAAFSIVAVFAIVIYILYASFPAFREIGVFNFLFKSVWAPTHEELDPSERFGILPMIVGSLSVTFGAVLIGGTFGVFTAVFMAYYCPKKIRAVYEQLINLLAGIPSIVVGFFGIQCVVPALATIFGVDSGKGLLASSLVLGIMILPTVASLSKNSLKAVPESYYEGSLALGNTKNQTVFRVILPAAKKGIISALILGIGRAVGETMAVALVAGNSANFPTSFFTNITTLTINVVLEMGYSTGLHKQALIATGFVLLVFILILNLCIGALNKERKAGGGFFKKKLRGKGDSDSSYTFRETGTLQNVLFVLSIAVSVIVAAVLASIIVYVFSQGLPKITWNHLAGVSGNGKVSLAPAFKSTGMVILLSLAIALPLGIGAAIYLNEYAKKGSKFVRTVRLFMDTLSGIPSIIFGLFGMIFFGEICGFGYSLLSGSLTIVLIILPTIIRSTEQSLSEIPDSMREGSLALGSSKVRTNCKDLMPSEISGIVTAII